MMKRILLTVSVTIFILSLSAALTVLRFPLERAYEWMLALTCTLSSLVGLVVLVGLLLYDITQTDGRRSNRRRVYRSKPVNTWPQATHVGKQDQDSEKISPLARRCTKRDHTFEQNTLDNRVATSQQPRPNTTFVPGRKPMSDWHRTSARDNRQSGYHNINERKQ